MARQQENQLRREQEAEYQQSLEQDRAKQSERRRLESERAEAENRVREEQENKLRKKQKLADIRNRIRAELLNIEEPQNGNVVRISVRFPSGANIDAKFKLDDSLENLFKFVLVQELCPDDFSLITRYPNVHLKCSPEWYREFSATEDNFGDIYTFRQANLLNSIVVLVRDNNA